jgi:asparagine synthase (glutamine-hydrolysing)
VPFVDVEVFRAAFAVPGAEKIRAGNQKVPLKEAARAWLPSAIIDRPKASFGAPLRAWVRRDLREQIDDLLLDGELVGTGFLDRERVRDMVVDDRRGRRDLSKQLWQLLTLEHWYRNIRDAGVSAS